MKNKISIKMALFFSAIIVVCFAVMYTVNSYVAPRYYHWQMENKISAMMADISEKPKALRTEKWLQEQKEQQQVVIVRVPIVEEDNDAFNERVSFELTRNRVALNRFWITEDTLEKLKGNPETIQKEYNQDKQKASFLVQLKVLDNQLYVVGVSTVHFSETSAVMNRFNGVTLLLTLLVIISLVFIAARKMVQPLIELKEVTGKIAEFDFVKMTHITTDEIGDLSQNINRMSTNLQLYQQQLVAHNTQLKQLIADLTHELKTPIALIGAYSAGIKDGLDDGTYLTVIQEQNNRLNDIVNRMLKLSQLEQREIKREAVSINKLWSETVNESTPALNLTQHQLQTIGLEKETVIFAEAEVLRLLFDNIVSNSLKYASSKIITATWSQTTTDVTLVLSNQTTLSEDFPINKLWDAFYTHEPSRNEALSGTGLGLAIVAAISEAHGYRTKIAIVDGHFSFILHLPIKA
ncbi:sensor histidine kinase [Brochothrix thermosphacta]|uniref:sensor histidine kinase n=1 Tax=Brochothrix thermosphacta TaxID=2756 RepID=UPI0009BD0F80|nr:HAMP domain-containing sensor histidine kinase [Brochothrix thermosphacta]